MALAHDLAACWWGFANRNKHYAGDSDTRKSIISVRIDTTDSEYFDCNDVTFQEMLYDVISMRSISDDSDVAAVYDFLISEMEKDLGSDIQVIKIPVNVPWDKKLQYSASMVFQSCQTYIVKRDFQKVITIESVDSR